MAASADARHRRAAPPQIGSIRRECTDDIIPMGETHLLRTGREYVEYHSGSRRHQSLDGNAPTLRATESEGDPELVAIER